MTDHNDLVRTLQRLSEELARKIRTVDNFVAVLQQHIEHDVLTEIEQVDLVAVLATVMDNRGLVEVAAQALSVSSSISARNE